MPLSYDKGQYGDEIIWIGGEFKLLRDSFQVQVKDSIIQDIIADLTKFRPANKIARKSLLSFAGRTNHAASLLIAIRPFLQQIWAALHDPVISHRYNAEGVRSYKPMIWRKKVAHALRWLEVFFITGKLSTSRTFMLSDYLCQGTRIELATGTITEFFSTSVTAHDEGIFGQAIESQTGQQL